MLAATKNDRTHQVEIDPHTLAVVRAARARADHAAAAATLRIDSRSFLFSHDPDGRRPTPDYAPRRFIAARRAAGLSHF